MALLNSNAERGGRIVIGEEPCLVAHSAMHEQVALLFRRSEKPTVNKIVQASAAEVTTDNADVYIGFTSAEMIDVVVKNLQLLRNRF